MNLKNKNLDLFLNTYVPIVLKLKIIPNIVVRIIEYVGVNFRYKKIMYKPYPNMVLINPVKINRMY